MKVQISDLIHFFGSAKLALQVAMRHKMDPVVLADFRAEAEEAQSHVIEALNEAGTAVTMWVGHLNGVFTFAVIGGKLHQIPSKPAGEVWVEHPADKDRDLDEMLVSMATSFEVERTPLELIDAEVA